jgi:NADH-quinone oxidoreductase subunit L
MEAPVPASALIHSATLVSAGVFLIIRFFPVFELSNLSLNFLMLLGCLTSFYGGIVSMHQSDTKKILAYSTISHCGFLVVSVSLGILEYTMVYLYAHGFFKALTFMAIGNINRFNKNTQDFKKMGVYYKYFPLEIFVCFLGLLNLSGLPFSLGFYAKHFIFSSLQINSSFFIFIFANLLFGAITGIFYCFRLFFYVFFDFKKSKKNNYNFNLYKHVNSRFFTFSNLASSFSLVFLFFLAYFFIIYLFQAYLIDIFIFSDIFKFKESSLSYINNFSSQSKLFNYYFINVVFLFFIFFIFTQK